MSQDSEKWIRESIDIYDFWINLLANVEMKYIYCENQREIDEFINNTIEYIDWYLDKYKLNNEMVNNYNLYFYEHIIKKEYNARFLKRFE